MVRKHMGEKQKKTKDLNDLIIILFVIVSFLLLIADITDRFRESNTFQNRYPTFVTSAKDEPGASDTSDQKELSPEKLEQLILNNMRGEAGG